MKPKIIYFDLETLPDMREVMRVFPNLSNYPGLTLKASINSIICFGYKIDGEKKAHVINVWDTPKGKKNINDDRDLLAQAFNILEEADAVVTHNGKRFDWKFLQTRLLRAGLDVLPKITHIDTCQVLKSNLMLFNNKLETASRFVGGGRKLKHDGWDLWVRVSEGDREARTLMSDYCRKDVVILEELFQKIRPLSKQLNFNLFREDSVGCPNCGSHKIQRRGRATTRTSKNIRIYCHSCGSWGQIAPKGMIK